jgi:hypothetical protein
MMRRRLDHLTFDDKLKAERARIEAALQAINSGPQRESLERKLSQLDIAFQIDKWLNCPELQPPE